MTSFFGSVFWLLVTLGVLVTFHEFGHYWVARRCGVKVLRFSVGFGKALWSRTDRHGTEFVVAAIPLGGYVKMLDEREGEVAPAELAHAYNRKTPWQRIAISAAGPAFNLIFTLAAFWLMFVIGKPDYQPVVGHVDHVAASAGFRSGDRITAIGGDPVRTWTDASMALLEGAMERHDLVVSVLDAGGTERRRTLALSQLPAGLDEDRLYRQIGLEPLQWALAPVIGTVQPVSAAARAGLRPGDRITGIEGDPVADWRDIPAAIQKHARPGAALSLAVVRGTDTLALAATPTRH